MMLVAIAATVANYGCKQREINDLSQPSVAVTYSLIDGACSFQWKRGVGVIILLNRGNCNPFSSDLICIRLVTSLTESTM
mgnify:CR=1 FL=1